MNDDFLAARIAYRRRIRDAVERVLDDGDNPAGAAYERRQLAFANAEIAALLSGRA